MKGIIREGRNIHKLWGKVNLFTVAVSWEIELEKREKKVSENISPMSKTNKYKNNMEVSEK